jgi:hypothetical protein
MKLLILFSITTLTSCLQTTDVKQNMCHTVTLVLKYCFKLLIMKQVLSIGNYVRCNWKTETNFGNLLLRFNWTANGFLPSGSSTTIRHNTKIHIVHKISHHTQTKHSTQSYTNNKGHISHDEYNTKKLKLSLQQAVEAYRVVWCRGSHVVQSIGPQMVVRLSTLHAGRALPQEIFLYSFLLQAE